MMHYFYHFDYDDEGHGDLSPMVLNIKLFAMAQFYLADSLKTLAKDKLVTRVATQWEHSSFADAIKLAFSMTDDHTSVIRDILAGAVWDHAKTLFNHKWEGHEEFARVAMGVPRLLLDYAKKIPKDTNGPAHNPANVDWYRCPGTYCKQYNTIFAISQHVPDGFRISCPLRCTYNKNKEFWRNHKI